MAEDRWIVADHNGIWTSEGSDRPGEVEGAVMAVVRADGATDFYGKTNTLTGEPFFTYEVAGGELKITERGDDALVIYSPSGWLRIEKVLDNLSVSHSMS